MEPMLTIALNAARKAGEIIDQAYERLDTVKVESKGRNDYVSNVDKQAEKEIIYHLSKAYPDHKFLGEESGQSGDKDSLYEWIIDPLDGTTNFLHGIPQFSVSIACRYKGVLEHAVVLDPIKREEYTASRGRGAMLNGRRIRVSAMTGFEGALIGTGIPFNDRTLDCMDDYLACLREIASQTAGIRRAGSAALDLAYVAAGRFDGFWELRLNSWDMAAGILLLKEAGGLISDFAGGNTYMESGNVVCGTPKVFKALLQVVQKNLGTAK